MMRCVSLSASFRSWLPEARRYEDRIDRPGAIDCVVAVLLTVGALIDAGAGSGRRLGAVSVLACAALTGSVALRRRGAALATVVAAAGLVVFVRASGYAGDGAFEAAAIAACFYLLGRRVRARPTVISVLALMFWLGSRLSPGTASRAERLVTRCSGFCAEDCRLPSAARSRSAPRSGTR